MKFTYLTNMRMPTEKAHGMQMMRMSDAFQQLGHQVQFFHPKRQNAVELCAERDLQRFYGLRHPVRTRVFWGLDLLNHWSRPMGQRLAFWVQLCTFMAHLRWAHPIELKQGVVYVRDYWMLLCLRLFFPKKVLAKTVFEAHGLSSHPRKRKRQLQLLRGLPAVVAVTGALKKQMVGPELNESKILVAHDGVDLAMFKQNFNKIEARKLLGLSEDWRILSFVGKFHTNGQEKGIPEIINSAPMILDQHPDAHFFFVGGPISWAQRYTNLIQKLGLPSSHFHFLDRVDATLVPLHLAVADVLLMPHPWSEFYAYHVSPLKMFEYMAAKKPIVASKLPAIMEVLVHGQNALLAVPGDPADMARQVVALLQDQALAERLSEGAYQSAQAHSWEKRAQAIVNFVAARV